MSGASRGGTRPLCVGTPWRGYNEQRNFLGLDVPGAAFVRVRDPYALLHALSSRLGGRRRERVRFSHAPPSFPSVDVLHFFNTVSSAATPWLVTFETSVPRGGVPPDRARRHVESPWCRRLIALSDCARARQLARWTRLYGDAAPVACKIEVLHPPQRVIVQDVSRKPDPARGLRFVFVGRHFFRKGGRPLLAAFSALLERGADVHLHVISTLEPGDRWSRSTSADVGAAREVIARHEGRITWQAGASPSAVAAALESAHVLLLPTLADTYGYSVLEGQAAGCASITTNVRALPEINPDSCGWTIELPITARGGVIVKTEDELRAAESAIRAGLLRAVEELLAAPGDVLRRGAAGIARIRAEHDPGRAASRLAEIYAAAVSGDVSS